MIKKIIILIAVFLLSGCAHIHKERVAIPYIFWFVPAYVNGECPEGYPIKGNDGSSDNIYHTPESPYYTRTNAERCFKDEDAAESFGYRKFKTRSYR